MQPVHSTCIYMYYRLEYAEGQICHYMQIEYAKYAQNMQQYSVPKYAKNMHKMHVSHMQ